LRAVNGFAKILEEDYNNVFDEEGKRLLRTVQQNASKMGMLIDDLLSFSRLGRKEIQKSPLEMTKLVESALVELNKSIKHKAKVKIHSLHTIPADSSMISQVVINLLSNAIKYSSKIDEPFIEIKSTLVKEEVIYSVSDNGTGFDMAYSDKLFGVFQRLHLSEEFEGTGVGLALVKRIIDKHEGKVWAEGEINKGATFYFSLPATTIKKVS
jgi:light-regulated signal transduction histidine kinase (bacteriophytochrome)